MADTAFMQQKFSVETMVAHYLEEIKSLRTPGLSPSDQQKLQLYYQAASTFKRVTIKDIVQFVVSYGRTTAGRGTQMRNAFAVVLGNRVAQPSAIDLAYARILLQYVYAFREYRGNLKEWMLRFLISSSFSPLSTLVDREIVYAIESTQQKIKRYEMGVG